ncbi:serine/threonine-protein kinase [Microcoleus sp. AT9b-C5]|uniref:serine/threonine-protein kinase n=1 Tax=unclassified Microcoleus TaxID=2642155 RepID=UPI002FD01241
MNTFPDFSKHGYQISRELGYNSLGGRVTYLATKINTKKSVVIKQFQFAQLGASWEEYAAYEQEIKVLKNLDRPGIPRYLDSFQTDSGFCMVQEYKNAESAVARTFSPPDIKQIAIATLDILVDLQSQKPPIIHRDIKPENLLIDDELNVYLVDFGFARLGGGNIAASSVVKGTMGFMPPEQMFNRELTKASDLYGLGITLICLLTGTKSADVGNLIDANYGIHFRHLVPPLQQGWMNWLERMVAPRIQDRYQSAADALTALESLDVSSLPKVRIDRDRLELTATGYGETITQTIEISNPIPDTMLAGKWEVAAHPSDPPHTPYDHPWISFDPQKFDSNELECQITVNTSKLLENKTYQRQIVLHANSEPDIYQVVIQVKSASLPESKPTVTVSKERLIFMFVFVWVGWLLTAKTDPLPVFILLIPLFTGIIAAENTLYAEVNGTEINWFGAVVGASIGITAMSLVEIVLKSCFDMSFFNGMGEFIIFLVCLLTSACVGGSVGSLGNSRSLTILALAASGLLFLSGILLRLNSTLNSLLGIGMLLISLIMLSSWCWLVVYNLAKYRISDRIKKGFLKQDAVTITFLTAGFCMNLGSGFQWFLKLINNLDSVVEPQQFLAFAGITLLSLAATGIPLLNLIVFKRNRVIANYRQSEPNLIKP